MVFKKHNIILILIPVFLVLSYGISQTAQAQTNNNTNTTNINTTNTSVTTTTKTFEDPKTGISFQYPSNWHIASKEYVNSIYGSLSGLFSPGALARVTPIVMLLPESLNGASFVVLSELLPFPISSEKYMEMNKQFLTSNPSIQFINDTSIHICNLNGYKYNVSFYNGVYKQTQIVFTKDSNGYVIPYSIGYTNQLKNMEDINSMIHSFSIR